MITAHLPLPLAERVDEMAARLQRSRGWIMKQALAAWMDRIDESSDKRRGFAEVQMGFEQAGKAEAAKAADALKALRATTTLRDISWRELRDHGRR